jgi:hypothetical protein
VERISTTALVAATVLMGIGGGMLNNSDQLGIEASVCHQEVASTLIIYLAIRPLFTRTISLATCTRKQSIRIDDFRMVTIVPHDMAIASLMVRRKGSQFIYLLLESVNLRIQFRVRFFQTMYLLLNCSGFFSL